MSKIKSSVPIILFDECASTNDEAARMLTLHTLPFVVTTKKQTSGRGRLNRAWFSSPEASICFSIACEMSECSSKLLASTTIRVGVAVCQALNKISKDKLFLKWTNDIYNAQGRKIAGMLAELHPAKNGGYNIVFGIGLNYDLSKITSEIPPELSQNIDDLRSHLNDDFSRDDVLSLVVNTVVEELSRRDMETLQYFGSVDWLKDRNVDVSIGDRRLSGVASGINDCGNLRLLLPDGSLEFINSGEATLHK